MNSKLCPSERAINQFEKHGPYTFEAALKVATICDRHQNKDGMQVGDTLNDISYKFSPEEFLKLFNAKQHCTTKAQYDAWQNGTDLWTFKRICAKTSNDQLRIIQRFLPTLDSITENIDWKEIPHKVKYQLLLAIRDNEIKDDRQLELQDQKAKRDASPIRS